MSIARRSSALFAALLLVAGFLTAFSPTDAGAVTWTYRSAVVQVGTTSYSVDVALSAADARRVTGPVQIVVTTSARVTLTGNDGGFANRGYRVSNVRGGTASTVTFAVTIPARGNVSAEVGVSSATGGAVSGPATTNVPAVLVTYR